MDKPPGLLVAAQRYSGFPCSDKLIILIMVINDVRCLSEYKRGAGCKKIPVQKTEEELALLLEWEKYRVQVNRVDITKPEWPGLPCD